MQSVFLSKSFSLYLKNLKSSIIFAILLVSVIFFASFNNFLVSSGSIFFSYSLTLPDTATLLLQALAIIVFLVFYSFFVTVIVFSVRKELSAVRLSYYISDAIRLFSFKLFAFFLFLAVVLYLLQLLLLSLSIQPWVSSILLLILTIAFLFVPQSIVVDEESLLHSILSNFEFIRKNPATVFLVLVVGAILLTVLQIIEFQLDKAFLLGNYFSLFIAIVFLQPFLESMKTYFYMIEKFDLIKYHELKTS